MPALLTDPHQALEQFFGFREFLDTQEPVVSEIVSGRDVLVVMPTGGGKSLCYQLPALMLEGVTLVVSPLIALMKDQVDGLARRGLPAAYINSSLSLAEQRDRLRAMRDGAIKLLYVSPERFRSEGFMASLRGMPIGLFAVDEAHCLSIWGHDFRPDYFRLGQVVERLGRPQVAAFTATATPEVRADIIQRLGLREHREFVAGFARPNLRVLVTQAGSEAEKYLRLRELVSEQKTGIIYCATRKRAEAVSEVLRDWRIPSILYHGGLGDEERELAQNRFISGDAGVAVATNAFGMGIDRPDIRFVAHFEIPGSLEAYYQEIGRAGRDGEPAVCELLFNYADTRVQDFFIQGANPGKKFVERLWDWLKRACNPQKELHASIREMASACDEEKNEMAVSSALSILDRAGVLDRFDVPGERVRGTRLLRPELGAEALPVDWPLLLEKEQRDRAKLKAMVEFAYGRACRQKLILDYFGEPHPADCQNCDNCALTHTGAQREPSETEALIVRKALSGVARMSLRDGGGWLGRYGRGRIIQVLLGSRSREILEAGLDRLSTHGLLKEYGAAYLQALFRELVNAGLIVASPGPYPLVSLTGRGDEVMRGRKNYTLLWPDLPGRSDRGGSATVEPDLPYDTALFDTLRTLRAELARKEGVPAYRIFPDATLKAFARSKPTTRASAMGVKGVGESKAKHYLEPFLAVIRGFDSFA